MASKPVLWPYEKPLDEQRLNQMGEAGYVAYQITCAQQLSDELAFAHARGVLIVEPPTVDQILLAMERDGLAFEPMMPSGAYEYREELEDEVEIFPLMDPKDPGFPYRVLWANLLDILHPIRVSDSPYNSDFAYLEFLEAVENAVVECLFDIDQQAKAPGEPHVVSQALLQRWKDRP